MSWQSGIEGRILTGTANRLFHGLAWHGMALKEVQFLMDFALSGNRESI